MQQPCSHKNMLISWLSAAMRTTTSRPCVDCRACAVKKKTCILPVYVVWVFMYGSANVCLSTTFREHTMTDHHLMKTKTYLFVQLPRRNREVRSSPSPLCSQRRYILQLLRCLAPLWRCTARCRTWLGLCTDRLPALWRCLWWCQQLPIVSQNNTVYSNDVIQSYVEVPGYVASTWRLMWTLYPSTCAFI